MNEQASHWEREFVSRRITRREFVERLSALGFSAGLLSGILARSDRAFAQTPQRGGHMRIGWYTHSASDTLNPRRLGTSLDFLRAYQIGSTLVRYGANAEPEADLAESWQVSSDGMTWRFKIRRDVEFHNGKSLTPEDVIYSLALHIGDNTDSVIKAWLSPIKELKKEGNDTVVIVLDSPNADLPMYLGDMHAVIVPDGFTDFDNMIGTGPFRLRSFRPGVGMSAERFENYHIDGRPYVDEVESFGIGDSSARLSALLAGDVDCIVRVDPKTIGIIESTPGVTMAATKSSRHITMPMMCDRPPTDNLDLRLAIKHLVDRDAILENIYKGYGTIGNDTPIGPNDRYFCTDIPQRSLDLEKARFHLKKAGMENLTLDLHTSEAAGGPQGPDTALFLKETAAKIGLNLNVIREPAEGYWSNVWYRYPFHMSSWNPRPTADLRLSLVHSSDAEWNETRFKDERLDAVILEARGTVDEGRRHELYCEAQRIIWERGGSIVPVFLDWLDARSERLKGWRGNPLGEADGLRIHEMGWLSD